MKRYSICLCLLLGVSAVCFAIGFAMTRQKAREEFLSSAEASLEARESSLEEAVGDLPAANADKKMVSHTYGAVDPRVEEYYLVCEEGFVLVFLKDRKTICLHTHIPITDFPLKEQARIREGIWFSDMLEVFNYLESYTS